MVAWDTNQTAENIEQKFKLVNTVLEYDIVEWVWDSRTTQQGRESIETIELSLYLLSSLRDHIAYRIGLLLRRFHQCILKPEFSV